MSETATLDSRRWTQDVEVDLPIRLGIGLTESEVRGSLGTPTAKYRNTLIFDHEHEETVRSQLEVCCLLAISREHSMTKAVEMCNRRFRQQPSRAQELT
jgi:hypothetical protein